MYPTSIFNYICSWKIFTLLTFMLYHIYHGLLHIYPMLYTSEVLACASNPCLNGATCFDHNGGGGYACLCSAGYEGTNCENGMHFLFFPLSSQIPVMYTSPHRVVVVRPFEMPLKVLAALFYILILL